MVIEIPNVTFIKNIDAFFKEVLTKITKRYVKYLKQFIFDKSRIKIKYKTLFSFLKVKKLNVVLIIIS